MVAPVVAAAGIGAASSLLGGALGRHDQRRQQRHAEDVQREFAQHGIQWRVADAKAAGLHPLFALGASTAGPAIPIMDDPLSKGLSEAGQHVAGAVRATETPAQRDARQLALAVGASQIARNYSEAAMFDSQAARNLQEGNARPGMPPAIPPALKPSAAQTAVPGDAGKIQVVPSQTTAHATNNPGIEAAVGTGMKWFNLPSADGQMRRILLPAANSMSESLESLSESYLLAFIVARENMKANKNFIRENAHWLPYGDELYKAFHGGEFEQRRAPVGSPGRGRSYRER